MTRAYGSIYDITVTLGGESINYPGDTPYSRDLLSAVSGYGECSLSRLTMSAHAGTHLDAPAHFIQGGKTIDQYLARDFILPAQVVEITDPEMIRTNELENIRIEPGEALLFKTQNSVKGLCRSGVLSDNFVYLSEEAAEFCASKKVGLVGIDYISVERLDEEQFPVHRILLGNNRLILEGVDLLEVPPGSYTLVCLPLKIEGCEASPVRAILVG
jgi:arylformamidase